MGNLPKYVKISEDALIQKLGNEVMILNLSSEHFYSLDEVGGRLWDLFTKHEDVQQVFDIMMQEYNVEAELLMSDMTQLIKHLSEQQLISVS